MDVLGNMGIDGLRALVWVVAILAVIGTVALQVWLPVAENWRAGWRHQTLIGLRGLLAGAVAYMLTSAAMVFYIMTHATDPRWSAGHDTHINTPRFSSGLSFLDGLVSTLNDFSGSVERGINDVLNIQSAYSVSEEFFRMVLWGLIATVCVAVPTFVMGFYVERWRTRHVDDLVVSNKALTAKNEELTTKVDALEAENRELRANLADMRMQLGLNPFTPGDTAST